MLQRNFILFSGKYIKIVSLGILLGVFGLAATVFAQPKVDPEKQREVNNFGADLDFTIHRQYNFLEIYGRALIDDNIQAVPYRVNIIQPKRKWSKDDKIYSEGNSVEIIQHGFIYDVETFGNEPVGRKYKTLLLKFTGSGETRKLASVELEIYEKNYKNRTYFWVHIKDKRPNTDISENFIRNYKPDASGDTATDKDIEIQRRSNADDSEQIALEMAAAMSGDGGAAPKVIKTLSRMKNTPAQPLRNTFKNEFYRKHLASFSNIVFSIYEIHRSRAKDSDSYMLNFLRGSTTY